MIQFGGNFILYGLMFADIGAGYTIIVSPFYVFFFLLSLLMFHSFSLWSIWESSATIV